MCEPLFIAPVNLCSQPQGTGRRSSKICSTRYLFVCRKGRYLKFWEALTFVQYHFCKSFQLLMCLEMNFLMNCQFLILQSYVDDSQMIVFCKCRPFSQNVTNPRMRVCTNTEVHPSGAFNQIKNMELQMRILVRLARVFSCQRRTKVLQWNI